MPFAERRLTNPTTLSTVASTVYTVPSQYTTIVKQVVVTNTTASPASFNLYIGSATAANAIFSNTTISANDSLIINLSQVLSSLEILTASANANSAVNMTISGVENNGPLDPANVYIADGAITTSKIANSAITTDKIAANAVVTADIANNAVTQAKLDTAVPLSGMRNLIINGNMSIAQRGGTVTTSNGYTLDRWFVNSGTNATISQSTDAAGYTGNSLYSMKAVATGTQQIFVRQAIETLNAIQFAGKTVILSAFAGGISSTTNLNMSLAWSASTDNGVSGTWTDITPTSGGNLTLSGTMTRFTGVFAVPSTARSLRVQFVNNAANFTVNQGFYLGDVQLEVGSQATPFEQRPYGVELQLCQRYYYKYATGSTYSSAGLLNAVTTTIAMCTVVFPAMMRTKPSSLEKSGNWTGNSTGWVLGPSLFSLDNNATSSTLGTIVCTTGGATFTAFYTYHLIALNDTNAYFAFNAEL